MAYGEGADPRNATLKDSEVIRGLGRLLVNDGVTNTLETTDATNICIGVSAGESSRDADHDFETSGATVAYYPLGGVLMVQSATSKTYTTGCLVYVGADGLATATAGSNKVLGIYVGEGQATGSALLATANSSTLTEGELIPVMTAGAATA
ncbi:MAG: hypothetical protein CMC15_14925 [Flavobacteriaceae bacterium]|nr:hypothetical protein [Flavobacteriaceae bacterium]